MIENEENENFCLVFFFFGSMPYFNWATQTLESPNLLLDLPMLFREVILIDNDPKKKYIDRPKLTTLVFFFFFWCSEVYFELTTLVWTVIYTQKKSVALADMVLLNRPLLVNPKKNVHSFFVTRKRPLPFFFNFLGKHIIFYCFVVFFRKKLSPHTIMILKIKI